MFDQSQSGGTAPEFTRLLQSLRARSIDLGEEELVMDVQVEETVVFYRKLSVTVPQIWWTAFDSAFKRVEGARIPGFRPGKAPRSVLQAHYGPQINAEVQDSLVQTHLPSAMAQSEVTPVARPALQSVSLSKGKDFTFVATVEIQPDIELTKWEGLEIEKVEIAVEDAEVEARLDSMRQQHSQMVPVEDRTVVEQGDFGGSRLRRVYRRRRI